MKAKEFQDELILLIEENTESFFTRIQTFEELGYLTSDEGFVLKTDEGEEFEVTIVKRK